jgi:hypothetical protein
MNKKKPWKTKVERDIIMHEDIKVSGQQGGKIIGEKLSLLAFVMGIPLLAIGLFGLINMLLGYGFPVNSATIILVIIVIIIGSLSILGGYQLYKAH